MVLVFSATRGSALALALAHSRGLLDYDERACTYWPEFAQAGKEKITVRQLLAHQAALFAFDAPVDKSVVATLDRLAVIMAQQKPAWEPGAQRVNCGRLAILVVTERREDQALTQRHHHTSIVAQGPVPMGALWSTPHAPEHGPPGPHPRVAVVPGAILRALI